MSLGKVLQHPSRLLRLATGLVAGGLFASLFAGLVPAAGAAVTQLADQPFITTVNVAGNVALTLSVEYPTATSIGEPSWKVMVPVGQSPYPSAPLG